MPDTGAPWNIPYVAPSDLVRDYPSDSEDLADAIALGLSAAGNPGIGSNVVQTVKTNTFSTTSNSMVDVTDLDVTITPSSATAKVLVLVNLTLGPSNATAYRGNVDLVRGSTTIATRFYGGSSDSTVQAFHGAFAFLDSPGVATATTYKIQVATSDGVTLFVGRTQAQNTTILSQITAIEVAA